MVRKMRKMKKMKLKKRFVALLLVLATILTFMPFITMQTAKADYTVVTDHFQEVFEYARSLNVNGNYAHSYLVGTALNDKLNKSYVLNNTVFNTASTGTLRGQVQSQISGLQSVSMSVANHPTNDGIYYLVTSQSDSMIGFLFNGYILYNSSSFRGPRYCECNSANMGGLSFDTGYKLITTQTVITDTSEDIGDNFCAYINVVGLKNAQHSKTLSYHRDNNSAYVTTPMYANTNDQNNTRQIWTFRKHYIDGVWDGYYSIESYASPGWYLNLDSGIVESGRNIIIHNYFSTIDGNDTSSLWRLVKNDTVSIGRQCYYLKSKANNDYTINIDTNTDRGADNAQLWKTVDAANASSAFYIYKINEVTDGLNAVINCVKNGDTRSGHFLPFNLGHISGNIDYDGGTRPTIATDNQATDNLYVTRGA
ncbi:MAG: RICIN domain-containing protein, partial [Acutalibacteraceae bacterium]